MYIFTSPFCVVVVWWRRFQLQVGPIGTSLQRRQLVYPSMASAFRRVVKDEGLTGLWRYVLHSRLDLLGRGRGRGLLDHRRP
jgi:hypothetical protein